MAKATLLLPNFNNAYVLPLTFEYLRKNIDCSQVNFVMVDDGSEDDGVTVAKAEIPKCGFASAEILERSHEGIVPTLNTGLAAVKTDFVVRIDGDATVETPGWLDILLSYLRHPEVGMAGGHVLFDSGKVHSFGRSIFTEMGLHDMGCYPVEPVGRRTFDSIVFRPTLGFQQGPPYEADSLLGICVAFRTEDARAAGGFDIRFNPVWIEDDDFGIAIRMLGRRIVIDPSVHVLHRQGLRGSRIPGEEAASRHAVPSSPLRRLVKQLRKKIPHSARLLAHAWRNRNAKPISLEDFMPAERDRWRANILRAHYASWKTKWGFDPINPDMSSIFQRYWDSPFCWRCNPQQLEKSRAFLKNI